VEVTHHKTAKELQPLKGSPTGSNMSRRQVQTDSVRFSVLVCAELQYTNSQIWFIRFDVDQSSKLVCVGNQAGEVFVWMLSGSEFVQVLFVSLPTLQHTQIHRRSAHAVARNILLVCGRRHWRLQVPFDDAFPASVTWRSSCD
jgi:hypothetical protein